MLEKLYFIDGIKDTLKIQTQKTYTLELLKYKQFRYQWLVVGEYQKISRAIEKASIK